MNGREEQFMSELNTRFRSAIVVVGLMLLGSLPSQAATYNFDFTSAFGYSVVGSLTTGNADGSGYDITSISGTIISANSAASGSIQGLVPGNATPPLYLIAGAGSYGNYYYDNIFIPTAPYFTTTAGLLFTSNAGFEYNFYGGGGCCGSAANTTYLSTTDGGVSSGFYPGIPGTLTVTDASSPEAPPRVQCLSQPHCRYLPPVLVLWAYSDGAGKRKLLLIEKRVG